MKRIKLSGKLGAGLYALVDDEDYERVNKYRWHLLNDRPCRTVHFRQDGTRKEMVVFIHNEILGRVLSPGQTYDRKVHVDHINGNPLDNRKKNLRVCMAYQNNMNRRLASCNTTGYKGVFWRKDRGYFFAKLRSQGRVYQSGKCDSARKAAEEYNCMASSVCGEFARLNVL